MKSKQVLIFVFALFLAIGLLVPWEPHTVLASIGSGAREGPLQQYYQVAQENLPRLWDAPQPTPVIQITGLQGAQS